MRFQAYYAVRAACAQSFAPLEHVRVCCGSIAAAHRDGGFYVFLQPLPPGAEITAECPGYAPAAVAVLPSGRGNVYLRREGVPQKQLTLLAGKPVPTGEREIAAVFTDNVQPQVLEGCTLDYGFGRSRIAGFDRISSVITLEEPLKKPLPHGMQLTIMAG